MKMRSSARTTASAALLLALAGSGAAQDVEALARAYVGTPAVQEMMTEMMSPESFAGTIELGLPPGVALSAAQRAALGQVAAETMAGLRPELERTLVEASARHFTAAELQALVDFYGSEPGASVARKMQPFFQDAMIRLAPLTQAAMAASAPRIAEILRER